MQECKRKLSSAKSGKPTLHAPSLDTIYRTYRNIDVAAEQQAVHIAQLQKRMDDLNVAPPLPSPTSVSSRRSELYESRSPSMAPRAPVAVTPNVAAATAAALNSERSSQRLKNLLSKTRQQPLLNTQAMVGPKPPVAFQTPAKGSANADGLNAPKTPNLPATPINFPKGPLFMTPPATSANGGTSPIAMPEFSNLPEDNFDPTSGVPSSSRRGARLSTKKHGDPVMLRRSPQPSGSGNGEARGPGGMLGSPARSSGQVSAPATPSPAPAPSFSWGPLPKFNNPGGKPLLGPSNFAPITPKK
jgi:nucleoporin NUP159